MRRLFVAILLLSLGLPALQTAHAQAKVNVSDVLVSYQFGEQVNIQAKITADASISDVMILFRAQGDARTRSEHIPIEADGTVRYHYAFEQGPLRSFARIDLWFRVTLQSGEQVESTPFYFSYTDNRFPWQIKEDGNVRVHWYAGDEAFGLQALDAARAGLQKTGQLLAVTASRSFDIYIYGIASDLQSAIEIGGEQLAVGGEAKPDLGISLVAITPGPEQGVEMERKIPHELAHLLTYQLVGQPYNNLPVWLREGIATLAEPADPENARALSLNAEQGSLIPINALCSAFPPEMSRVTLAYAESESLTRFIVDKYGNSGLLSLIHAYADGLDCQQGATRGLNSSLDNIENDWLNKVAPGAALASPSALGFLPYLAILAFILIVPFLFILFSWRATNGPVTR